eukprot:1494775-Prymnesium_polylepis.1
MHGADPQSGHLDKSWRSLIYTAAHTGAASVNPHPHVPLTPPPCQPPLRLRRRGRDAACPVWAHLIRGPIHAGFAIEVQVDEGSAD